MPALGEVSYEGSEVETGNTGGGGLTLDFRGRNKRSSFALDIYSQNGAQDQATVLGGLGGTATRKVSTVAMMLGGRWNQLPHGFYVGGGIVSFLTSTQIEGTDGGSSPGITLALGLTLGYDYKFANGFTLGAHLFRTTPTILLSSDIALFGEITDFYMQQVSFGIGYSW